MEGFGVVAASVCTGPRSAGTVAVVEGPCRSGWRAGLHPTSSRQNKVNNTVPARTQPRCFTWPFPDFALLLSAVHSRHRLSHLLRTANRVRVAAPRGETPRQRQNSSQHASGLCSLQPHDESMAHAYSRQTLSCSSERITGVSGSVGVRRDRVHAHTSSSIGRVVRRAQVRSGQARRGQTDGCQTATLGAGVMPVLES